MTSLTLAAAQLYIQIYTLASMFVVYELVVFLTGLFLGGMTAQILEGIPYLAALHHIKIHFFIPSIRLELSFVEKSSCKLINAICITATFNN